VTIGAKNFSEQYILARLISRRLEAAGYSVRYRENLGSAVILDALRGGDIDLYVDYSGTLWTNAMRRVDALPRAAMSAAIAQWAEPRGFAVIAPLGFENAYALALRGHVAKARAITTLSDLSRAAPQLTLGGDLEFLDRPEWAAIRGAYGLRFGSQKAFAPTFMYEALKTGDADVISAFSSDGRIAADGLVVLADPKGAIPAYDALLLANRQTAQDEALIAALRPLADAIPVELMRRANLMVDGEKRSPDAAAAWLDSAIAARRAR
jgi:osmoprotectant transport system permease protein